MENTVNLNIPNALKILMEQQKRIQSLVEPFNRLKAIQNEWLENSGIRIALQQLTKWEKTYISPVAEKWTEQQRQWQKVLHTSMSDETIAILKALSNQSLVQTLKNLEQYQDAIESEITKEIAQQTIQEISISPSFNEETAPIAEAVILGDKDKVQQFTPEQIYQVIIKLINLIMFFCAVSGYNVKTFIEMSQPTIKETICQEYQIENVENAEIRKVRLNEGTLNVYRYPKEKSKVLSQLPNGEFICLSHKHKGNNPWLKVRNKA